MSARGIWTYRREKYAEQDLTGMSVEALDGFAGTVAEVTAEPGASYVVVDTGPWISSRKVVVPAGIICRIDVEARSLLVDRTREQIRNAPEYSEAEMRNPGWRTLYQSQIGTYYGSTG